jgi:uracil-DNA glycosylase
VVVKARLPRCDECPFRNRRVVPGYGPDDSQLVIVGEAPGNTEVLEGVPFVGQAGGRLDVALVAAHLERGTIYITNAVLCQPPHNQSPPPKEAIAACRKRLIAEMSQRMPRKVLALGVTSAEALTPKRIVVESDRGHDLRPHSLDSHTEVRVTYHPSALHWNPKWPGDFDDDVGWLGES